MGDRSARAKRRGRRSARHKLRWVHLAWARCGGHPVSRARGGGRGCAGVHLLFHRPPSAQQCLAHRSAGVLAGRATALVARRAADVSPGKRPPRLSPDVIVIGAGAIGASAALHLARAGVRVTLLEKEKGPAQHESGRNSGVIHAGYNLKPGSLKAKYCVEGSWALRQYCRERGIAMEQGGILIVARSDAERVTLAELHRRAQANGVRTARVDERGITELEPHARGIEALSAPEGASFDATAYVAALLEDARAAGARVEFSVAVRRIVELGGTSPALVLTSDGSREAGVVLNCAGLYADRLAGALAGDIRIIPFRGYYAELRPGRTDLIRSHVYAAPDLAFPFLGVHLSRRTDGRVIVGPGAMLAFGHEAYRLAQVQPRDLLSTLLLPRLYRLIVQPRFRALVRSELMKSLFLGRIAAEARLLIPELRAGDLVRSYAGNRAQVVSRSGDLVDDIVVRRSGRTVHVLNAVSPGLTCSLPFGRYLAEMCIAAK